MTRKTDTEIMLEIRLNNVDTDSASQEAYNSIYEITDIAQSISFYRWFYKHLALKETDTFLDISCGNGLLLNLARAQGIEAYGMDLSLEALRIAKQRHGLRSLAAANSQLLPFADESFTVISNVGSLEHYVDMPAAIRETARVLNSDGRCVILVPNTFSLLTNIWHAYRKGRTSFDPYQPIQRYGARYEWQELLEDNGLHVNNTIKFERVIPKNRTDFIDLLGRPKELIRLLLSPIVPLNLAFCFIYFCGKSTVPNNSWQTESR